MWSSRKKLEHSICPGLVVAARQSRVGSKFLDLKILIFLLLPKKFTTNQGLYSKFPHPTPRLACQCPYAKEIRRIRPKMTELEPFSWRRSKFLNTILSHRIAIFNVLEEISISAVQARFFFYYSIIAYILGRYHVFSLNPDFWARAKWG